MSIFHITHKGEASVCKAKPGKCPLREADGSPSPHGNFSSLDEARTFVESVNKMRYEKNYELNYRKAHPKYIKNLAIKKVDPYSNIENLSSLDDIPRENVSFDREFTFGGRKELHYFVRKGQLVVTYDDDGNYLGSETIKERIDKIRRAKDAEPLESFQKEYLVSKAMVTGLYNGKEQFVSNGYRFAVLDGEAYIFDDSTLELLEIVDTHGVSDVKSWQFIAKNQLWYRKKYL